MIKHSIYQVGTINSLLEAVYEGDTSIATLKTFGDFGLGALNDIDGELIVCDGECYRANSRGELTIVSDNKKTPFAVVNKFVPEFSFPVNNLNYPDLEKLILAKLPSLNLIYALRLKSSFKQLQLRSEECTQRPYRKLTDILPDLQRTFSCDNVSGILVGVWFPQYMGQLNVPGFHFHFIDDERTIGGHVFGLELLDGVVEVQTLHRFELDLIKTADFYNADLDKQNAAAVAQVEQVRT